MEKLLVIFLLVGSSAFAQKDTTKKVDPDPIIILQIRSSKMPALLEVIDNSGSNHMLVKQIYESFYTQYKRQTDTAKKK